MSTLQFLSEKALETSLLTYLAIAFLIVIIYIAFLAISRFLISPLAKFPGPKLAAFTKWTEAYYELFKGPGGQFCFEYAKWHRTYGPIIRITPNELHIQDSKFYEVLYSSTRPSSKLQSLAHRFNSPMSAFSTVDHALHRRRRAALNPFFSRRRISEHQPNIQDRMNRVVNRISKEYLGTGKVLPVDRMWGSWTSDIIVEYSFGRAYDFIENPDFKAAFTDAMIDLLEPVHFVTQFPSMMKLLTLLPDNVVKILQPGMASVLSFNHEMIGQIIRILNDSKKENGSTTIFGTILASDLPADEKSVERLQHEAISVVGAGIETTMRTLTLATFHIIDNPPVYRRLRKELLSAMPNGDERLSWDALSNLPYLSACIDEALRFAYGTSQRLPRTIVDAPLQYEAWTIPTGTTISMDNYAVSHDEEIFPDSFTYRPERWLNNPKAPDGKQLSRYLVAFGRGTRSCVGMQLAYAELFTGISTLFRRFDMKLYETDRAAVDLYMDRFVPRPRPDTKGVRVLVEKDLDIGH